MPINPRSYQDNYDLIKAKVQNVYPKSDFTEGSFLDVITGSFALAYQELQSLITQSFSRTFFSDPDTTGDSLNKLAKDHFNLDRPMATKSIGTLTITRNSGNSNEISIPKGTIFTTGAGPEVEFKTTSDDVTIAPAVTTAHVNIEASLAGSQGNIATNSDWSVENIPDITISNGNPVVGGSPDMSDEDFKEYIIKFVQSISEGTVSGLENTAKLIPGVFDAKVIKKLVDVGTLTNSGVLEASPKKFKAVELLMYVAGESEAVNTAILNKVKEAVEKQLSAGETINITAAGVVTIDITAQIAFAATAEAIELSEDRPLLIQAVKSYINDLAIGTDFNKTTMQNTFASKNNWETLITSFTVTSPMGNITGVPATSKPVAGNVVLN